MLLFRSNLVSEGRATPPVSGVSSFIAGGPSQALVVFSSVPDAPWNPSSWEMELHGVESGPGKILSMSESGCAVLAVTWAAV